MDTDPQSNVADHDEQTLHVPAPEILPGDRLPPQRVLHGTRWQRSGFKVGPDRHDVRADLPVASGQVLLFGADGGLNSVERSARVTVHRVATDTSTR